MGTQELNFSIFAVFHKLDESPDPGFIKKYLLYNREENFDIASRKYVFESDAGLELDRFYWCSLEYQESLSYNERVYNDESKNIENNPRKPHQKELSSQLFAVYDTTTGYLFLNNSKKRNVLEFLFNIKLSDNEDKIVIKPVYISYSEFSEKLKLIKEIHLQALPTLFNTQGSDDNSGLLDFFKHQDDILGLNGADKIEFKVSFRNVPVSERFTALLNKLNIAQKQSKLEKLICTGFDDNNLEVIFNTETFNQKVSVEIVRDNNSRYSSAEVKDKVIKKLEKVFPHGNKT